MEERRDRKLLFIAGEITGAVLFLLLYGYKILIFTYDDWLLQGTGMTGDLTQHYLGWEFLRKSELSFPFGLMEGIAYPEKVSIIYTDSIPILAVFFRCINFILPKTFQYFGLYGIICFMLQGGFSAMIMRKFTDSKILCLVGSLFFIMSPIMLDRMYYHTALAAHFLILWAIYLWIYREYKNNKEQFLQWGTLTFLCASINLYLSSLILGIQFCAMLAEMIYSKKYKFSSICMAEGIGVTLFTMYLFGGFYGNVEPKMVGLGEFSYNLNGFINPQGKSFFLNSHALAKPGQREGFSYFGAGMLIIIFVAIFMYFYLKKHKKYASSIFEKIPLTVSIVVFSYFSISPIVTYNEKILFTINYPKIIIDMLSVFRSSGRFIWVVYYIIMICAIGYVISIDKKEICLIFTGICFLIQLIDFSSVYKEKDYAFRQKKEYISPLQAEEWDEYAEKYKHIMIYVPLWDLYVYPDISYTFEKYALENDMTLNGIYFSRDLSEIVNAYTMERFVNLSEGDVEDDTLYIFLNGEPSGYGSILRYREVDGYTVGIMK